MKKWKLGFFALLVVLLGLVSYKTYLYGRGKLEEYICERVEERVTQELTDSETSMAWAANCGYIAGYYAHKMGLDCPVSNDYFYNFHAFVEELLPQENLKEITGNIIDERFDDILRRAPK